MKPAIHLFEEHAHVLPLWWALRRERGEQGPVDVVYLDAHLDLQYVSAARIDRLRACASQAQVEALVKPHPLMPDGDSAFGIEDFLYPAARLGLIDRVFWVAPPHVDIDQPLKAMAWLQQMQGVTADELASFHVNAQGWLEGRLLGLHLCIGRLHQLSALSWQRPCVWDIDVDYCIGLPGDKVWITPDVIAPTLHALPCQPLAITVSKSVGSGFTPARFDFLGEWFVNALDADAPQATPARVRWAACLPEGQAACEAGRPGETPALVLLRQLTEIRARRMPIDLGRILWLSKRVAAMAATHPATSPATQALLWAALGLLFAAMRMTDRAMGCAQHYQGLMGSAHAGLAVEIGRQLMASGACEQAQAWLRGGLHEDETRVPAHVYLAQACSELGAHAQASRLLEQAIDLSPAWAELHALRLASIERQRRD